MRKGFLRSLRSVEMTTGKEQLPVKELILASGSPQRKRILRFLRIPFKAVKSGVREEIKKKLSPRVLSKSLALAKAEVISRRCPSQWVLGVDTLVVLSNKKISGKPRNKKEAKEILKTYRGAHCDVVSGIALLNHSLKRELVETERTRLYFRNFTEKDIDTYLTNSDRWRNSSGAVTIEGVGGRWVKRLEGDYWNVVGLPIVTLKKLYAKIPQVSN